MTCRYSRHKFSTTPVSERVGCSTRSVPLNSCEQMNVNGIFFDGAGRFRSGWRVGIFILAFAFALLASGAAGLIFLDRVVAAGPGTPLFFIVNGLTILIAALLAGWLCGRLLERLPFRALGAWVTKGWLTHLSLGILAGAATLCIAVLIAFVFGGLRFATNPVDGKTLAIALTNSFIVFAAGAAWEEALFRGYILQTLDRSHLAWLGIGVTSLFFGAIHLGNPNPTIISTVNTMLAGAWFGIAYLKTRDLWFVWGMHLMWNWMQGAFFGIEVSGLTDLVSSPLLKEIDSGPLWLTGETYGIEGGIVTTIALIASTVVIWYAPFLRPGEKVDGALPPR